MKTAGAESNGGRRFVYIGKCALIARAGGARAYDKVVKLAGEVAYPWRRFMDRLAAVRLEAVAAPVKFGPERRHGGKCGGFRL